MKIYKIGDKVWYASRQTTRKSVICPECFGKKYLTVILGDDSQITIDCVGCASGYDPPTGSCSYYEHGANVSLVVIGRVEINSDYIEYGFNRVGGCMSIAKDTEVFPTKKEAEIRAEELAEESNKEQLAKIHRKEKNNRTWAWHVHYHRRQIRDAEKTIEYAKQKLDAAKAHTKEKKEPDEQQPNHMPQERAS